MDSLYLNEAREAPGSETIDGGGGGGVDVEKERTGWPGGFCVSELVGHPFARTVSLRRDEPKKSEQAKVVCGSLPEHLASGKRVYQEGGGAGRAKKVSRLERPLRELTMTVCVE